MAINGDFAGAPFTNVFWSLLAGGVTATQAALDAWVDAFVTAYKNNLLTQASTAVTLFTGTATLFQPGETALHSNRTATGAGVQTGPLVTNAAASRVISWLTSVYWRGGKPRTYLPGVLTSQMFNVQHLAQATITELVNEANAFHTAVNALSATGITQTQHGFVSFRTGGIERNPSVFFPISGATVHDRVGTQRGRLGSWTP